MIRKSSLYDAAVEASKEYLGPAGERFMRRQITTHLGITPEDLRAKDVEQLVTWVRLTFAVLTDNTEQVDAFAESLLSLKDASSSRARVNYDISP